MNNSKKTNKGNRNKRIALIMALMLFAGMIAVPQQTFAAAAMYKKAGTKYMLGVHNINSNTVLKKGARLKISYTATKKKGGVVTGTKVKFKSSNKKVATVSKGGVIKAKKKGTVKITVYCKSKKSKKKTVKIRVGTPVSSVKINGYSYLRPGRGSDLDATVNKGATNKSVSWWSDNKAVATVSSNGYVKAKSPGVATVYAKAKDGSGVYASRKVVVHRYTAGETKWIAHRGLHTSAKENTAAAFTAAGNAGGYWGCECDIWETKHVVYTEPLPEDSTAGETTNGSSDEGDDNTPPDDIAVTEVADIINSLGLTGEENMLSAVEKRDDILAAKVKYDELDDAQKYKVREALKDGDKEGLGIFLSAISKIYEYDSIDIAINHDSTFSSVWGHNGKVRELTGEQIQNTPQLRQVCFLEQYLAICKSYGMVPVIEFKDPYMSHEAVNKVIDMVEQYELLDEAYYISFHDSVLSDVKATAQRRLGDGKEPITYYLISSSSSAYVDLANSRAYTGVSFSKDVIESSLYNRAKSYGLGVGTWTYRDKASNDDKLYRHLIANGWNLDFVTIDYKLF